METVGGPTDRQTDTSNMPFFEAGHNKEHKTSINKNPQKYKFSKYFWIQELRKVTNVYISKTEF